jgi:hypothetical protein
MEDKSCRELKARSYSWEKSKIEIYFTRDYCHISQVGCSQYWANSISTVLSLCRRHQSQSGFRFV